MQTFKPHLKVSENVEVSAVFVSQPLTKARNSIAAFNFAWQTLRPCFMQRQSLHQCVCNFASAVGLCAVVYIFLCTVCVCVCVCNSCCLRLALLQVCLSPLKFSFDKLLVQLWTLSSVRTQGLFVPRMRVAIEGKFWTIELPSIIVKGYNLF